MMQKIALLDSLWASRLVARDQSLQQSWEKSLVKYRTEQQKGMAQFAQQLWKEEMPELASLIQNLQIEQQQELGFLLSEFWIQWQETRTSDLQSIETELANLYKNVERNQTETEALIQELLIQSD